MGAAIILALILIFGAFVLFENWYYIEELEYRTAKHHTIGEISVVIDGTEMDVSDIPLQMLSDNGNVIENTVINKNKFNIKKGMYGINQYKFVLPISNEGASADNIVIQIDHFNTNWWHVSDVLININISTEPSLRASMTGSINTRTKSGFLGFDFETQEKDITQDNNTLQNRTESP